MKSGLGYGHFTRMTGAEEQGTKKLQDYYPNGLEIIEYWTKIFEKLTELSVTENEYSESAREIISGCIRSISSAGRINKLYPYLDKISVHLSYDWEGGLRGLKETRKYEKNKISTNELNQINSLITKLTKTDFASRYLSLADTMWYDDEEKYSHEKVEQAIIKLADEFIETKVPWEDHFPLFYTNNQMNSFVFGRRLFELLGDDEDKVKEFIDLSIETLRAINKENRNVRTLGGFLVNAPSTLLEHAYAIIFDNDTLNYLLFYLISTNVKGYHYYDILFKLIDTRKCNLNNFNVFNYSDTLRNLNLEQLDQFSERLFGYGEDGYSLVFDLYFNISFNDSKLRSSLHPVFKKCIYKLGAIGSENTLDKYAWSNMLCSLLENPEEKELAAFINQSVISSITLENSYHLDNYMKSVYDVLMKTHFFSIWNDLSMALLSSDEMYVVYYGLKHILGSRIGGIDRKVGVLFEGDLNAIFEWCEKNKPLGPSRLAELAPIFSANNDNYGEWHPITKRLIDEFGDIEDVRSHLRTNMGNYSWSGSTVPLLQGQKNIFHSLEDHPIKDVSDWAMRCIGFIDKEIEFENNRDAEMYL